MTTSPSSNESGIANESTSTNRKLVKRYSLIGDMYRARRLRENSLVRLPGLKSRSFSVWNSLESTSNASRQNSHPTVARPRT